MEQAMSAVLYPHMRRDLAAYLTAIIFAPKDSPEKCREDLHYLVHFLFDDTSLAENPSGLLSWVLESEDEVLNVSGLVDAMNNFLASFPEEVTPSQAFESSLWLAVISRAKELLVVLLGNKKGAVIDNP